jgi:hypothetical protein
LISFGPLLGDVESVCELDTTDWTSALLDWMININRGHKNGNLELVEVGPYFFVFDCLVTVEGLIISDASTRAIASRGGRCIIIPRKNVRPVLVSVE